MKNTKIITFNWTYYSWKTNKSSSQTTNNIRDHWLNAKWLLNTYEWLIQRNSHEYSMVLIQPIVNRFSENTILHTIRGFYWFVSNFETSCSWKKIYHELFFLIWSQNCSKWRFHLFMWWYIRDINSYSVLLFSGIFWYNESFFSSSTFWNDCKVYVWRHCYYAYLRLFRNIQFSY